MSWFLTWASEIGFTQVRILSYTWHTIFAYEIYLCTVTYSLKKYPVIRLMQTFLSSLSEPIPYIPRKTWQPGQFKLRIYGVFYIYIFFLSSYILRRLFLQHLTWQLIWQPVYDAFLMHFFNQRYLKHIFLAEPRRYTFLSDSLTKIYIYWIKAQ